MVEEFTIELPDGAANLLEDVVPEGISAEEWLSVQAENNIYQSRMGNAQQNLMQTSQQNILSQAEEVEE